MVVLTTLRTTSTILLWLIAATLVVWAQQPDRPRTEVLAERGAERLAALHREADQLAADERTLLNELRALEIDRQIKGETLSRLAAEEATLSSELDATTERIDTLQSQEQAERTVLRAQLAEMYKLGRARYVRMLLSTSDLREIGRASRLAAALAEADRRRVTVHQQTIASLKTARYDLEERTRRLQAVRGDAAHAAQAAVDAAHAHTELVNDIDRRRDLNAELTGELQAAQQRLQTRLRDLSAATSAADAVLPLRPFRGAISWPVAGPVRRLFGNNPGARGTASNGIEIAARQGAPIAAVHDGIVAYADSFTGFGNLVIVDHGAQALTVYGDLLDVTVTRGARIERGQLVGHAGTAPVGASGLYFELRIDGQAVDPLQWLAKR